MEPEVSEIDITYRNMANTRSGTINITNSSFKTEIRAMSLSIASNGLTLPNFSAEIQLLKDRWRIDDDVQ